MAGSDPEAFETLDPQDLDGLRALAHRMVDDAFEDLRTVRDRPAWQPIPEAVERAFDAPMPRIGEGAEAVYREYRERIVPYPMGNTHPRFWAWYMGNGTMVGALGAFLAAHLNPNLGGGNHAAPLVERQVVRWCAEMVGMPADTSGLLTSGASMANLVGHVVARHVHAGVDVRAEGVRALPEPLVAYGSVEIHSCHQRALELLGLGHRALRKIPVHDDYTIDVVELARAITEDRAAGKKPFLVIANAGTINTGAVDDLAALADLCAREGLWYHVDAAIGGPTRLSARLSPLMAGIERADSVALDLHKWLHVPFEAGVALVRDEAAHIGAFTLTPPYLEHTDRGVAGGATWFSDYGIQLSRDFKALKAWFAFKERGLDAYARVIERNVDQAHHLADRIDREPLLERMAPVTLDIVCFRVVPEAWDDARVDALNRELLLRIHESGEAVPSYTTLNGRYGLRVAIGNHRSTFEDFDTFVDLVLDLARTLTSEAGAAAG